MPGPLLRIRDASFGYEHRPILEHVSLELGPGEFVALLGPNGAGKTTLLRGIVGLLPLLAGSLDYAFDRSTSPIGYVPQRDVLDSTFPLTAGEVVLMGSYAQLPPLRRVGRRERLVAAECLETVGLGGMGEERFASLSGGQRQRVLIARALAAKPSLLLLDEPTAGVDAEATAAIMSALSRLNRDQHLTILLVTHHVRMVRDLATAVFWVQDGRVLRGQVEEILTPGRLAGAFGIAGDGG